jgi:hypothetical protein
MPSATHKYRTLPMDNAEIFNDKMEGNEFDQITGR